MRVIRCFACENYTNYIKLHITLMELQIQREISHRSHTQSTTTTTESHIPVANSCISLVEPANASTTPVRAADVEATAAAAATSSSSTIRVETISMQMPVVQRQRRCLLAW